MHRPASPRSLGSALILGLGLGATFSVPAFADVALPAIISDHAVLQKSYQTALWGTASPDEKVTATLSVARGETVADSAGAWRLTLDLTQTGPGPHDLVVAGNNRLVVSDVIVGEVWVASGQSNMEFTLNKTTEIEEAIAAPPTPHIRQFLVRKNTANTPRADCQGTWTLASPETVGNFSAVGYHFARSLHQRLQVPVGLIHTSWGGTPVEAWTSTEALDTDPELKAGRENMEAEIAAHPRLKADYVTAFHEWAKKYNREDAPVAPATFTDQELPAAEWKPVTLPGSFSAAALPDAGVVWLKKIIPLHGEAAKGRFPLPLNLGVPEGFETVYYNGKRIAAITPDSCEGIGARHVYYPGGSIDGDNVLAVRLYTPAGNAGVNGELSFYATSLKGEWLAKVERELPSLDDAARQSYPRAPKVIAAPHLRPGALYNGMIAPLVACTIRGIIWYQGESNDGRAYQYRTAFPLMISDWRRRWGRDVPFYYCQLTCFRDKRPAPSESAWAELRESQTRALSLPHTGQAILIDLGETGDVHPRNKKEVGNRLGLIALNKTYAQPDVFSGPVYKSHRVEGDKIRLTFGELHGGLVAKPLPPDYIVSSLNKEVRPLIRNSPDSELEGFAICGVAGRWVWANAVIEGDTIIVSSPAIKEPVAVRYAWADSPTANLYNQAGLPAGPFRTDEFKSVTQHRRFGF
ncbi:MAG: acetylesterase [Rariglobus sp.]|jgi:sialate O-acetylesterase|nr:acetylesterase [Rariglobus sp.]